MFDGFDIDDDLGGRRFEAEVFDVCGGDAEDAENESADFVIDLATDEETDDLRESELNGVGIFEGQVGKSDGFAFGIVPTGALRVKMAKGMVAEGRRSALGAVDFNVLTTADGYGISWHKSSFVSSQFSVLLSFGARVRAARARALPRKLNFSEIGLR